jgi:hypothetical protein
VTITGKGFPTWPPPAGATADTLEVRLGPGLGSPCEVVSADYFTITCVAGPQPAATPAAGGAAGGSWRGYWPGMRGVVHEYYYNRWVVVWVCGLVCLVACTRAWAVGWVMGGGVRGFKCVHGRAKRSTLERCCSCFDLDVPPLEWLRSHL